MPKEAGKFELWDGEVIVKHGPVGQMNAERSQHWDVKGAAYRALHNAIKRAGVALLRRSNPRRQPQVIQQQARGAGLVGLLRREAAARDVLEVPNPLIVVEVLSPAPADDGPRRQAAGLLFALPSLNHYLVIDPDRRLLIHHKRGLGDAIETRIVSAPSLRLDPPGLDLDLAEVLAS